MATKQKSARRNLPAKPTKPKEKKMDRGVQAALENKNDAIVDLELALRAKLTDTAADDQINPILDLLENEAKAINAILDDEDEPTIDTVSPADATALQNAINKAETSIKQTDTVQSLISAAAVLVGTIKQTGSTKSKS
jgi:hypothetical protein